MKSIKDLIKEENVKLSEEATLKFLTLSEASVSWQEIFLVLNNQEILLGKCFSDSNLNKKEWIEYNEKCVIFYSSTESTTSITKVMDLDKLEESHIEISEIPNTYGLSIKENVEDLRSKNIRHL